MEVVKYNYSASLDEFFGMSVQSMFTNEAEFLGIMDSMVKESKHCWINGFCLGNRR